MLDDKILDKIKERDGLDLFNPCSQCLVVAVCKKDFRTVCIERDVYIQDIMDQSKLIELDEFKKIKEEIKNENYRRSN